MALLGTDEVLQLLLETIPTLSPESAPLDKAGNRILAAPVKARLTQPPFNSSAMDGYGIRFCEAKNSPLTLVGEAAAGRGFNGALNKNEAIRIFTGAPVPAAVDTVVMQEHVERDGNLIHLTKLPTQGANIRPMGGDFSQGDIVLEARRLLSPSALSLCAASGHDNVSVYRRPHIAILATGDELVEAGTLPGPDQIIASNNHGLRELIRRQECEITDLGIAADNKESIRNAVKKARNNHIDILVTSGGVSVGEYDLVQDVLREEGMKLDFWKIAMRPGKPLMFGKLPGEKPLFILGLPGNPVSSLICARLFLLPIIAKMTGRPYKPEIIKARLKTPIKANGERRHYMRATLARDDQGFYWASEMDSQDSSLLTRMAHADGLIIHEANAPALNIGDLCNVLVAPDGL